MSDTRNKLKINRTIEEFKGSALMIGCGEKKIHHFQLTGKPIEAALLHPSQLFYHVSLPCDYSDEGHHDLEGDFLSRQTINYLSKNKYDLICFEAVTEIFSSTKKSNKAIQSAKKLLSAQGLCFIFFGGRSKKSLTDAISQFDYSYSFTYGFNDSWSLIGSNKPFDLFKVIAENNYLNYMGYHVIKNKINLCLSYNYYEAGLNDHVKTIDQNQEIIDTINPFLKSNGFWSTYKEVNLTLQETEEFAEDSLEFKESKIKK